jgi:hypothetical protein
MPDDMAGLNEVQMDRELMRRGIGFVLADPGRYIQLSLSRVADFFEFWPTSATTLLNNLGRVGSFGLMLPFMIYGMIMGFKWCGPKAQGGWLKFSTTPLAMTLLFVALYSIQHVLTWAMPRYRLPVDAVLVSFAALGLSNVARWIKDKIRSHRTSPVAYEWSEEYTNPKTRIHG